MTRVAIACIMLGAALSTAVPQTPRQWPYEPGTASYEVGNNFGAYQKYEDTERYYHNGIDILAGKPRPVYAVAGGTVVYLETRHQHYSGVIVGEPGDGGTGYLYMHLNRGTMRLKLRDQIKENDYLGDVVDWPSPDHFDHLHFSKVRGRGRQLWQTYEIAGDPLGDLTAPSDPTPPVIEPLDGAQPFLFSKNQSSEYLPASALNGPVDILARIADRIGASKWRLAPHQIEWSATGAPGTPTTGARMTLDGALGPPAAVIAVWYRNDSKVRTHGDYDRRELVFVVTHGHVDRPIITKHSEGAWDTRSGPDGEYVVRVTARDRAGNTASATQTVRVVNTGAAR